MAFSQLVPSFPRLHLVTYSRFLSGTLLPSFFRVPLLRPNSKKKGTLIIKGPLRNLAFSERRAAAVFGKGS